MSPEFVEYACQDKSCIALFLRMQVDYRQPYVRGTGDKFKTALEGTAFNNRKTSGVFNASMLSVHPFGNSLAFIVQRAAPVPA